MTARTPLKLAGCAVVLSAAFFAFEQWRADAWERLLAQSRRPAPIMIPPPAVTGRSDSLPAVAPEATSSPPQLPERAKRLINEAKRGPGGVPMVRPEALFADLPNLKAAFTKAAEGQQRLGYAQFIRTAALSAREEQAFVEILANREAMWGDIRATAINQGLAVTDPVVAQMDEKNSEQTETKLRELLGPDRYVQLQAYRETLDSRLGLFCLSALVYTSYATEQPLTLAQMNCLATVATETGVLSYDRARGLAEGPQFDRALDEAAKILTPAQMEVFGLLVDQRQIWHARAKIMNDRRR